MTEFDPQNPNQPWLAAGGEYIPLSSPFKIGRSSKCRHVINKVNASREHSLLQYDDVERRWLIIDLGSTNGTYVNGQRIMQPVPLRNGDQISIGDEILVFHKPDTGDQTENAYTISDQTVVSIDQAPCWLLIADVKQSTQLIQQISQQEWSERLRIWAEECKSIVHGSGGLINEYMGDGLLAFWRDAPGQQSGMADVLKRFNVLESASGMDFRIVCHYGLVGIGGGMSSGLEKLAGEELNFVFKAEKPAGRTGKKINLTQAAVARLGDELQALETGDFSVPGFAGSHKLFTVLFESQTP